MTSAHTSTEPAVTTTALVREFRRGSSVVRALDGVDLTVNRGELVAIRGRSGAGKTTLLNILGGLDQPTSGEVTLEGRPMSELTDVDLIALRRERVSFIFQAFGLIPILSAAENVEVPLRLVRTDPKERDERVLRLLEQVGLARRVGHRPHELSGGEQQRVAIARALANSPDLILADEPTGQLDSKTGEDIMRLLRELVDQRGLTILVATHDNPVLDHADRVVDLKDGRMVAQELV